MTLDVRICTEAKEMALRWYGTPEVFHTDHGSQFTSAAFTGLLKGYGIAISMNGQGSWRDIVFVGRL